MARSVWLSPSKSPMNGIEAAGPHGVGWPLGPNQGGGGVTVRLCEPLAVALAESVRVAAELLSATIVVPTGMPVPVTLSPTASPVVVLRPVTDADPFARTPVKLTCV